MAGGEQQGGKVTEDKGRKSGLGRLGEVDRSTGNYLQTKESSTYLVLGRQRWIFDQQHMYIYIYANTSISDQLPTSTTSPPLHNRAVCCVPCT